MFTVEPGSQIYMAALYFIPKIRIHLKENIKKYEMLIIFMN